MFKPEEEAEIKLGTWLISNGFEVLMNRECDISKKLSVGTFIIKGSRRKPDMIFYKPDGDKYVVEIKSGIHGKQMRDSHKILTYLDDCSSGTTKYYIKRSSSKTEIKPTCFLVASQYSIDGHLTRKETIKTKIDKLTANIQGRPQTEYSQTFDFVRMLWQLWNKDKRYTLGALLSDKLNGGKGNPSIFIQKYNKYKNRWFAHRFYVI